MIRRLRKQHLASFGLLACVLPVGIALALTSRQAVPASPSSVAEYGIANAPSDVPARDLAFEAGPLSLRLRLWSAAAGRGRILELTPQRDPEQPDLLVYWADSQATNELPKSCVLLGSLAGTQVRRFELPAEVRAGRLYFYSLAHQELVATSEFER